MIKRLSDRFWNYLTDRIEARMDLRPDRDDTLDLGSSDYQWRRVYVGPGSVSAPAVTLDGDTDTGIYQSAADNLDFAVGGAHLLRLKGTGAEVGIEDSSAGYIGAHGGGTGGHEGGELQLHMAADHDGTYDFWFIDVYDDDLRFGPTGAVYLMLRPENTAAAPLMAFKNDLDTGIYQSAADNLDITTGGTRRVNVSSAGLRLGPTGSQTAPALAFISDTNTGIYQSAADNLDITTGGTRRVNVSSTGHKLTSGDYYRGDAKLRGGIVIPVRTVSATLNNGGAYTDVVEYIQSWSDPCTLLTGQSWQNAEWNVYVMLNLNFQASSTKVQVAIYQYGRYQGSWQWYYHPTTYSKTTYADNLLKSIFGPWPAEEIQNTIRIQARCTANGPVGSYDSVGAIVLVPK